MSRFALFFVFFALSVAGSVKAASAVCPAKQPTAISLAASRGWRFGNYSFLIGVPFFYKEVGETYISPVSGVVVKASSFLKINDPTVLPVNNINGIYFSVYSWDSLIADPFVPKYTSGPSKLLGVASVLPFSLTSPNTTFEATFLNPVQVVAGQKYFWTVALERPGSYPQFRLGYTNTTGPSQVSAYKVIVDGRYYWVNDGTFEEQKVKPFVLGLTHVCSGPTPPSPSARPAASRTRSPASTPRLCSIPPVPFTSLYRGNVWTGLGPQCDPTIGANPASESGFTFVAPYSASRIVSPDTIQLGMYLPDRITAVNGLVVKIYTVGANGFPATVLGVSNVMPTVGPSFLSQFALIATFSTPIYLNSGSKYYIQIALTTASTFPCAGVSLIYPGNPPLGQIGAELVNGTWYKQPDGVEYVFGITWKSTCYPSRRPTATRSKTPLRKTPSRGKTPVKTPSKRPAQAKHFVKSINHV
mmetsp:Transcript_2216/g.3354  ORF Transcript_2216/g.3354 Transcript_2216/m.3354 type:complete len:472 (-) Transcript_2216:436-1851(-)